MERFGKAFSKFMIILISSLFLLYLGVLAHDRMSNKNVSEEPVVTESFGQSDQKPKVELNDPEELPDSDVEADRYNNDDLKSAQLESVMDDLSKELEE